jgi:DNA-binding CsgD family transcriptional regulator
MAPRDFLEASSRTLVLAVIAPPGYGLTAAEVRLLRLLGTRYSFREIREQLSVSQYTVKSQAMSIYRKFAVSRSEAIRHARDLACSSNEVPAGDGP